ncbi:MAG: FGGY family carbohydrate kinase [bacterium]|nr:FGGY family carbohydrate kinase [bacterium]
MTMRPYLLGLDYGTGGAKAALIDCEGRTRAYAFEEFPILTPHPGWSEHEPARYWDAACRMIRQVLAEARVPAREIGGVAVSSALPSLVMVDRAHNPIGNAYNLMDRRATRQVQAVKDLLGEARVFAVTKNRLDDHPSIINLMWERDNRPDQFRRVWKALTIDGFITLKLTGVATGHYSGAAFYGVAYDLLGRTFNQPMLDAVGIPRELFPDLYPCTAVVGEVTAAAAEATGLAPGTPVAAGQVDCNAGWSGAGAIADGDIQMNLGTCGNFGIIHTAPTFHDSMIACNYTTDTVEQPVFVTIPTTTTGGQLLRYLRDNFYLAEKAAERTTGTDTYELINREAAAVPAGAGGLVMLPFLMGERTPIWDVHARAVIFGLSLNHTRGHVARAAMEAVAYALYDSFRIITAAGQQIRGPIVLNEGGAKSALWRRIITDVFNVPTVLVKSRVGAPYGDAILAGVATGVFKDFSVTKEWVELVEPLEPDAAAHARYQEYFALYKRLYEHVKEDYRELARLRARSI